MERFARKLPVITTIKKTFFTRGVSRTKVGDAWGCCKKERMRKRLGSYVGVADGQPASHRAGGSQPTFGVTSRFDRL